MFTVFQTNTTAYANELMDDFYYLGADRMPLTQTAAGSLTAVDATYDLGSSTYRWDDVYADNLYITNDISSNSQTLWVLESEVTLSATASAINFVSLDGDTDSVYKIIARIEHVGSATTFYFAYLNQDSASNYGNQYMQGQGAVATAVRGSTSAVSIGESTQTQCSVYSETIIYGQSGFNKVIKTTVGIGMESSTVDSIRNYAQSWSGTGTITSIKLSVFPLSGYAVGTNVQLWKRG